jgi:lysophosphatidylcholine acyltransferase/lyso-PAF acetyltransferase
MNLDCPSFLSKYENSKIPVVAQVATSLQSLFLKRGDTKEKRAESIKAILDRQLDAEKGKFPKLLIFPEGATTNGTCLIQFKKGAFLSLRSVQPLYIQHWTATKVSHS